VFDVWCDLHQRHYTEVGQVAMGYFDRGKSRQAGLNWLCVELHFALLQVGESCVVEISTARHIKRLQIPALANLSHAIRLEHLLVQISQLEINERLRATHEEIAKALGRDARHSIERQSSNWQFTIVKEVQTTVSDLLAVRDIKEFKMFLL